MREISKEDKQKLTRESIKMLKGMDVMITHWNAD